jgi:hypothetical protein
VSSESPSEPLALIAGSTQMPLLVAQEARRAGRRVLAAAIRGITDPALEAQVDALEWLRWGDLPAFLGVLDDWRREGVTEAIMAGKVEQQRMYERDAESGMQAMLSKLPSGHTDELLGAVAGVLESSGIFLLPSTCYLSSLMPTPGWTAGRQLTDTEDADIRHGWRIAKALGKHDIGQTIVVKEKAVAAVEGMEGTDACVRRGGDLVGPGSVVVKVAKPGQDLRFDVPVVGVGTLENMHAAGASALAVEADLTVLFDRDRVEELARKFDLALIARAGND